MAKVRPPAVAGLFYPSRPDELAAQVSDLLERARADPAAPSNRAAQSDPVAPLEAPVKALIVPHAGYIYSGPTAAIGYTALDGVYDQVVLLGPCHRVGTPYVALPGSDLFRTPLGDVPVWPQGVAKVEALAEVVVSPEVHAREHSLEVQLPFLQTVLGRQVPVLPLAVGWSAPEAVAAVLEAVWGGPETLIVVSSDLSHYLPYATARQVDQATLARIMALAPDLESDQACGVYPVNGLSAAAASHRLRAELLDYRNSGDTAGDRDGVVGYAAISYRKELSDAV
ncbi:MAG: AmmeMemoRadiSam system protein B [Bifidobacteriaceae bacterium]|jgi:AmmeMemoRadiSam system protein B|nr:AmmeMemoRadiSam system protein B [Bifidobacteriaceae bacterium]